MFGKKFNDQTLFLFVACLMLGNLPGPGFVFLLLAATFGDQLHMQRNQVTRTFHAFKTCGYFETKLVRGTEVYTPTKKAFKRLEYEQLLRLSDSKKESDGIMRIIIFDINEKRAPLRRQLRANLQKIGFKRLQRSVYTCNFPCETELKLILKFCDPRDSIQVFEGVSTRRIGRVADKLNLATFLKSINIPKLNTLHKHILTKSRHK